MNQGAYKIKQLLNDGKSHCARELEELTWSKHKRIEDAERIYGIKIARVDCVHGIKGAYDYGIHNYQPPKVYKPMPDNEAKAYQPKTLGL